MPTTPEHDLPYPDDSVKVALLAEKVQELAEALDAALGSAYHGAALAVGLGNAAGDGFTPGAITVRKFGNAVMIAGSVTRAGSVLNPPADGNMGNLFIGRLNGADVGLVNPVQSQGFSSGSAGRMCQWVLSPSTGSGPELRLVATANTDPVEIGQVLSFNGVFVARP